ncbi:hypothetical protein AURDEDRAFT_170045 [Auricularia subglabra TFB-10046 SS5]|uniref:Hemerythrin-like domain-containing protein n=1 Tax=Auricularia subglabra (strain TFB-10046 / SS5) TaxID=717982 RepID=J0D287_AURST|nr:hypothetical protein AURDEDRAFT_170045 [Auricularia subglabra TFB-10046 SS5]
MSAEAEQHAVMHRALDDLLAFLRDPKSSDKSAFDAGAMGAKMAALKEPLYAHLDAEVAHIAGKNLQAFTREELEGLMAQISEHAHKHADPFTELPFMLRQATSRVHAHIAPPHHGRYPELPWLVRKVLVPIFAFRHRGYWKYAPFTVA